MLGDPVRPSLIWVALCDRRVGLLRSPRGAVANNKHTNHSERITIIIKCGTIAAVVIAGSAAGTERVAAGDQVVQEHAVTARGTRAVVTAQDGLARPVGNQLRRGERPEYEPTPLAIASSSGDGIRRGIR